MLKLYCKIVGADHRILVQSGPESRKKVVLLGNAILIPVFLWMATGYLLAHEVLKKDFNTSILCSLFCSVLIFLVERQILMAKGNWQQTIIRIVLGFCMAAVGSIALDEIIFEYDIDLQVQVNKNRFIDNELEVFKSSMDKNYLKLNTDAENAKKDWKKALGNAISEADGTGGSGKKGVSAITNLKLTTAGSLSSDYQIIANKLEAFKKERANKLEIKEKELSCAFNPHSLLIRIKAMYDLVVHNTAMLIVYLLFSVILFILEFIVIITKGAVGTTTYDRKMNLIEEIGKFKTAQLLETSKKAFDPCRHQNILHNGYRIVESQCPSVFN